MPRSRPWQQANTSPNTISPPNVRNSVSLQAQEGPRMRSSMSQGASSRPSRTVAPGPVESPTSSMMYNTTVTGLNGEERPVSGSYAARDIPRHDLDVSGLNRRNSADPGLLSVTHNQPADFSGQEPRIDSLLGEIGEHNRRYQGLQHQRPSISNASVSLASDTPRGQAINFIMGGTHAEVDEVSNRTRRLDIANDYLNGHVSDGYSNAAGNSLQLHPSPQPLQHEMSNGARHFGNGTHQEVWTQQEVWTAAPRTSYSRRRPAERSSPAGSSYRHNHNSPGNFSGTPHSRDDPWNRPISRNGNIPQDLERQQQSFQYSHATPGFVPSYPVTFPSPYDQYTQIPNYRHQVPVSSYGTQPNYIGDAVRPNRGRDLIQGARSPFLEEFRLCHRTRHYELREFFTHVVECSGDQHASRCIQERLITASSEEKERVFEEILPNALQLMKDVFGNYVIQKLFEHGNQIQKRLLAQAMTGRISELSMQMYSCRVVQKALDYVLLDQQHAIVDELRSNVVQVTKDPHGNHVVQKAIHMFPARCIPFIMETFQGQVEQLATQANACRVIQRILEHGTDDEKKRLMVDIHACSSKLMMDQFGNYVIQHILEFGEWEDRCILIRQVTDRALALSRHKYASNVVEKCIKIGTVAERRAILSRLRTQSSDGTNVLQIMMKDQYANYVVQKLLEFLEGGEKTELALELRNYVPHLKKHSTSRQNTVLDRLTTALDNILNSSASTNNNGRAATATAGTVPSTPNLAVEVGSAVPTPSLTTEQSSPQSCSPPSTSISTSDEAREEAPDALPEKAHKATSPVRVQEN
ncbi:ARM repeat-containing protein [Xylaria palmicola]|nr:ARM repeat-containing protein [Xylaria palmicola]